MKRIQRFLEILSFENHVDFHVDVDDDNGIFHILVCLMLGASSSCAVFTTVNTALIQQCLWLGLKFW